MKCCQVSIRCPHSPFFICIAFCCFSCIVNGQTTVFMPSAEDTVFMTKLYVSYENKFHRELAMLPEKNKKDFEAAYKERWEYIKDKFDKKEIYTSANAQHYLDALVNEIKRANPILQNQPFECYFSRSGVPNASYIGERIILFNMGLFEKLDNESEAAFVVCHEIAHYILKHTDKRITDYVNAINSDEVQNKLKTIKGSEYRKGEQLEKLVKSLTFDYRRH